jgi:hypothetical protein
MPKYVPNSAVDGRVGASGSQTFEYSSPGTAIALDLQSWPRRRPMRIFLRFTVFCLVAVSASIPGKDSGNWSGKYSACDRHSELLKAGHLKLGVRSSTSPPELAAECAQALDFWTTVLDMEWHEDNSRGCRNSDCRRPSGPLHSRPDRARNFRIGRGSRGWIAFNPRVSLSETSGNRCRA